MRKLVDAILLFAIYIVVTVCFLVMILVTSVVAITAMAVRKKPAMVPKKIKRALVYVLEDTPTVNLLQRLRKAKEREITLDQLSNFVFAGCIAATMSPVIMVESEDKTQAKKTAEQLLQSCERRGIEKWKIEAFFP